MTPKQLADLIVSAGLNQTSAAKALGINRRTIVRWLSGDTPISKRNAVFIRSVLEPKK